MFRNLNLLILLSSFLILSCSRQAPKEIQKKGQVATNPSSNPSPKPTPNPNPKPDPDPKPTPSKRPKYTACTTGSPSPDQRTDESKIPEDEIGQIVETTGESYCERNDFEINQSSTPVSNDKSLAVISHITDTHIIDEEAPGRVLRAEEYALAKDAYRPQEDLTTQVFDTMVGTINRINKDTPIDFMLFTGDTVDNGLKIEIEWFKQVLDGGEVNPDSGKDDDPFEGRDANDPFTAKGSDIPWYVTFGNHDMIKGLIPPHRREAFNQLLHEIGMVDFGGVTYDLRFLEVDPAWENKAFMVNAPIAPNLSFSVMRDRWKEFEKNIEIEPDARRIYAEHKGFIELFADDKGSHGFTKEHAENNIGYYTFYPIKGLPLKFISLDTMNVNGGWASGFISGPQVEFIKSELENSKNKNEAVIFASHHPSDDIIKEFSVATIIGEMSGSNYDIATDELAYSAQNMFPLGNSLADTGAPKDPIKQLQPLIDFFNTYEKAGAMTGKEFSALLKSYPNVVAHIVGHGHRNKITAHKGDDAEHSYWEIQTASTIDYPQQSRLIEFVYEGSGVGAIYSTIIDHQSDASDVGELASRSRQLALSDVQYGRIGKNGRKGGDLGGSKKDRNVRLMFQLPESVKTNFETAISSKSQPRSLKLKKNTTLDKTLAPKSSQ